ncbi:MAG: YdeI/OmpD-associated family protein [Bacteroidota bacterium]
MEKKYKFEVELVVKGNGVGFDVPLDVKECFGTRARVPVKITVGKHTFRSSIFPMSGPNGPHLFVMNKAQRAVIGKDVGDTVKIVLERDTEIRTVEVPEYFAKALDKNPDAKANFEKFAFTHKREYVQWLEDAKKPETRQNRLDKAIVMLSRGIKNAR